MTARRTPLAALLIGFTLLCSCVFAAEPTARELLAAPEELSIADRTLVIVTYLWRDFMPISPPDGKPLIASIRLKTTDDTNLPKGIEVESVWVVNGELLWSPPLKKVWRSDGSSSTVEFVLRNGPKWEPGVKVDVVIRVKDGKGQLHLIKAPGQNINRTD